MVTPNIVCSYCSQFLDFKVQNVVASCDLKFVISLETLSVFHHQFCKQPKMIVLIFFSGKIVLTGAKRKEQIDEAFKHNIWCLLKRCRQTCSRIHLKSSSILLSQPRAQVVNLLELPSSPPVKTDLVLRSSNTPNSLSQKKAHADRIRSVHGCKQDNQRISMSFEDSEDSDSLKRLFKGLLEKVRWQVEAASAVTSAIMQSKSGNGKRCGVVSKADTWLLFAGPDKTRKRKMSIPLSVLVFGTEPIMIGLGSARTDCDAGESDVHYRGKMPLDRIASAIRQNPFSVIVLEEVDQADALVRGTIKRAIDNGRLRDSYGCEVGLGSAIFVRTTNWLPDELKESIDESLLRTE